MKKQIIAAAVATSVSAIAMADISISGNANYEYFAKEDTTGFKTNYGDTEVNLFVKGKTGDTTVVANFEIDEAGTAAAGTGIDVEDLYIASKIGDINVKAGDFASGTTALGGEIDNGSRAVNKVSLSTKVGPATVGYHVSESGGVYNTDGAAITASMNIAGVDVSIKEQSDSYTLMGAKGSIAGVNYRIENWDSDTAASDVLFYEVGTKAGGLNLSYAAIDADAASLVTEDDSSIFAQEMASASAAPKAGVDGVNQITVSTDVDGTTLTLKAGELTGIATKQDAAFYQIAAKRKLASGATINVSYDDYETHDITTGSTMTDTQVFEIDLSVAF